MHVVDIVSHRNVYIGVTWLSYHAGLSIAAVLQELWPHYSTVVH
jgi:hypothetical protein